MRGLILATQFLTRLPVPALPDFQPEEQARSVAWFPLVGVLVGMVVAACVWLGTQFDPWLGALFGLVAWVAVTGALHLDGLSDLADALGGAHRDPDRLLAILADPHAGVFGIVAVAMQLLTKLVLLMLAARLEQYVLLLLVPAWARLGVLWWAGLPSIKPGLGERFAWRSSPWIPWFWLLLLGASSLACPILLAAPLALLLWRRFLSVRLGGMTGDALGAGVEVTESLLLLVGVMWALALS
jgi:adenosylcobinamide-GDP ribazoletransferase